MKTFIKLYRRVFGGVYIAVLYFLILVHASLLEWLFENKVNWLINSWSTYFVLYVVAGLITSIVIYVWHKVTDQNINGLCYQVLIKCEIKDQYDRFIAVKECVETYEHEAGKCNKNTNLRVVTAAIEFDQAQCIVMPIMLTGIAFVIPNSENGLMLRMMIGAPLLFALCELMYVIPRNAFIKRVIESINEEINN